MSLSVELDEQTAALVQELAANDQRSASEVIHDALAVYACLGKRPCLPESGKYRSGRSDTSANARRNLPSSGEGRRMALICDTGGVYAMHDADDPHHAAVKFVVEVERGPLLLPVSFWPRLTTC